MSHSTPEKNEPIRVPDLDVGSTLAGLPVIHRAERRRLRWFTAGTILLAIGLMAVALLGGFKPPSVTGTPSDETPDVAEETRPTVQTIRPRRDPSVEVAIGHLCNVEAYYQSDLRARVSGIVRAVYKDDGDRVRAGEVLLEIDAPDLEVEVAQKQGMVRQRLQEVRVARARLKDAEATNEVFATVVRQRQAEVKQAEFTRNFRLGRLNRYRALAKKEAIPEDVVEEQAFNYQASEAAVEAARIAIDRAKADLKEAAVKVETAAVDIELKEEIVAVAQKDLEKSMAQLSFARITAPFDGIVVRRRADPGSFVQNASTGQSESLITIARTDLMSVVAKFPDNAAPFVTRRATAVIEIGEVPGLKITGRVTRHSPSIQSSDRTIRVEVDLFNDDETAYRTLVRTTLAGRVAPLASRTALDRAVFVQGITATIQGRLKGPDDPIPLRPSLFHAQGTHHQLLPGMTGTMKLHLGRLSECHVLPSSAVFSRAGKPYLLLVSRGVTKQVPVRIQVNDGRIVVVSLVNRVSDADGTSREIVEDLKGDEDVVATRQLELGDSQPVKTAPSTW